MTIGGGRSKWVEKKLIVNVANVLNNQYIISPLCDQLPTLLICLKLFPKIEFTKTYFAFWTSPHQKNKDKKNVSGSALEHFAHWCVFWTLTQTEH